MRDKRNQLIQGEKLRGAEKVRRIPIKVVPTDQPLRKPDWIRIRLTANPEVDRIKGILRQRKLASVCEEASCPNLSECFSHGTATFMIMGEICTRRCPFCDVAHGKPNPLDPDEPRQLAEAETLQRQARRLRQPAPVAQRLHGPDLGGSRRRL